MPREYASRRASKAPERKNVHGHALHGGHGCAELGSEVDSIEAGPRSSRNASEGGVACPSLRGFGSWDVVGEWRRVVVAVCDGVVALCGVRRACPHDVVPARLAQPVGWAPRRAHVAQALTGPAA